MYTEGFEQWLKAGKNLNTPMNVWNKTCTDMCKRITQQNIELLSENVSRMSERLKRLSNIRKPEDFFALQKDCVNEDMSSAIECMQKCIHTTMENMEEMTKLCSTLQESACENITKPMEKQKHTKS